MKYDKFRSKWGHEWQQEECLRSKLAGVVVDSESGQMFKLNLDIFVEIINLEHGFTGRNQVAYFTPQIKPDYHKDLSEFRMY